MKRQTASVIDLLPMDCLCGWPVADHFTAERKRLTCAHLQFIKELRVGQIVTYWKSFTRGQRPTLVSATIRHLSTDHDLARLDLTHPSGRIVSVSSVETHRFIWKG